MYGGGIIELGGGMKREKEGWSPKCRYGNGAVWARVCVGACVFMCVCVSMYLCLRICISLLVFSPLKRRAASVCECACLRDCVRMLG